MEVFFWISLTLLLYSFVGYPLLLKFFVSFISSPQKRQETSLPSISLIVSVLNEEDVIQQKIENFEQLDYPENLLEFIIVSDGSTDKTDDIVMQSQNARVRLLVQESNMGKTEALNRAVAASESDILVFTDANSMFESDALLRLGEVFCDAQVGLVSGHTQYISSTGQNGGGMYRRYEDSLKSFESDLWGIVGADGAIYALRKELYEPIEPQYINDFLHPIQVVLRGFNAQQAPQALCHEPLDSIDAGELPRQVRIMTQSWLIVFSQLPLLIKKRKWGFLWQLLSHKVLRWMTLPLMAGVLISNCCIVMTSGLYVLSLLLQCVFYGVAYAFRNADGGWKQLPYTFLLLHLSSIIGLFKYIKGDMYISWTPRTN